MRRIYGLMLGLLIFAGAGNAPAQIDCSGGVCTVTKYGLGNKPDYRKDEVPPNAFRYTNAYFGPDFGGQSYFSSRSDLTGAVGNCGPQRQHSPLPGQVLINELTSCTPVSRGPLCVGSETICHLPTLNQTCTGAGAPLACCTGAGTGTCVGDATSALNTLECGAGGTCTLEPGTRCRVEIPLSDGGVTPTTATSEVMIFTLTFNAPAANGDTFSLSAQTGNTIGGTSDDANPLCIDANVRRKPTSGWRYKLHASRSVPGNPNQTYIRWDSSRGVADADRDDLATTLRLHTDDSAVCCAAGNPTLGTCTVVVPPSTPNYPLLTQRNCGQAGRFVNEDNVQADWLFEGGQATRFHTDNEFVLPGQVPGLCKVNSSTSCFAPGANSQCTGNRNPYACCTGAGAGTCTQDCTGLDADPATPGIQPDSCDLRTPGFRAQVGACARDSNGDTRAACCGTAVYTLRGIPQVGCSVLPRFAYNGDPGADCGVGNYGVDHRDDENCDGVADFADRCGFYSDWDQDADGDGDCAGGTGGNCRGDECECGDQQGTGVLSGTIELGNGVVNVADLVGINSAIFGNVVRKRLCDANSDTLCTVSDIVGANREIFDPDSSICRQITPRQCLTGVPAPCCGNGVLEGAEACDDGNLNPGDGCNAACRIE